MNGARPDPTLGSELSSAIIRRCRDAGFALAGVAGVERSAREAELRAWIARGAQGSMAWLAETADARVDPAALLPGARAAVMVADFYPSESPGSGEADGGRASGGGGRVGPSGRIARYARGRDYHRVIKRRLRALCDALRREHPGHAFRVFADTAPVPERELAERAGLGWIGKHTLLISPSLGSWCVLGGFLTTLDLRAPPDQRPVADHCGTCTRCIDACPTGAITPYSVDARRCVSYLTIERDGPIDAELHSPTGDWLAGCDICQEVCPHNRPARARPGTRPDYEPRRAGFDLLEVLGWDEATRRARFASSALKRVTLEQMKRNAIIALGNHVARGPRAADAEATDPRVAARRNAEARERAGARRALEDLAWRAGEPEAVRELARRVLDRLES